jgi:formylmethanofuran dehydrogenase subunit E
VRSGSATDAEKARFQELHVSQSHKVLALDPDSLYTFDELDAAPPRKARIHTSISCAECGEAAMETRIRRLDGRDLCQPCFDLALSPVQPVVLRGPGRR